MLHPQQDPQRICEEGVRASRRSGLILPDPDVLPGTADMPRRRKSGRQQNPNKASMTGRIQTQPVASFSWDHLHWT